MRTYELTGHKLKYTCCMAHKTLKIVNVGVREEQTYG